MNLSKNIFAMQKPYDRRRPDTVFNDPDPSVFRNGGLLSFHRRKCCGRKGCEKGLCYRASFKLKFRRVSGRRDRNSEER